MLTEKRPRWKPLATLIGVLTVATAILGRFTEARRESIRIVFPASGSRCRFTVLSNWKCNYHESSAPRQIGDEVTFTSPPQSPIKQWIVGQLFHRPLARESAIYLSVLNTKNLPHYVQIQNGYPSHVPYGRDRFLARRHLSIDGHPATLTDFEPSWVKIHYNVLYVYISESSILYDVSIVTYPPYSGEGEREIQALLSSFHVEKVMVPQVNRKELKR